MAETQVTETWLEPVLSRGLGGVEAPDELWDRIQTPRVTSPPVSGQRLVWALAAALPVMALVWASHPRPQRAADNVTLAMQALGRGPEHLEFRSTQPEEVKTWVKSSTGLDLPIPAEPPPSVRLAGARVIPGRGVEVAYQVSGHDAVLLVSKASAAELGDGRHRFVSNASSSGTRISSWTMGQQLYTLACAGAIDFQTACRLCHADAGEHLVLN